MRITRTFELASKFIIIDDKPYAIRGFDLTWAALEDSLYRAIPNFHNLTSIDDVSDDSIAVTYNVREDRRL